MHDRSLGICAVFFMASAAGWGQWVHHPAPGTPRTKDGKANLAAPAPRGRDGKPDISGVWIPQASPVPEMLAAMIDDAARAARPSLGSEMPTKYFINVLADFKKGQGPLTPAAAKAEARIDSTIISKDDPGYHCLPTGMPMVDTIPSPIKIVQSPGLLMFLMEENSVFRQIYMDGRKFPEDMEPAWLGYSWGRWDGDTLVVETAGLNDRTFLDASGHRHSEDLKITERFHRVNFGTMELQMTLDDPKTFTRPVTFKYNLVLLPDTDLIEYNCSEDEKDLKHVVVK